MLKKLSVVLVIIFLVSVSSAQQINNVDNLKIELHAKSANDSLKSATNIQNIISESEELIRNYELLDLDGTNLVYFLNNVLEFIDTKTKIDSEIGSDKFEESLNSLNRLILIETNAKKGKETLINEGYNNFFVQDVLDLMETTIESYSLKVRSDLNKKVSDSGKLDEKAFFLGLLTQLYEIREYDSDEYADYSSEYENIKHEVIAKEELANQYESNGDLNLNNARTANIKFIALNYYSKSIHDYNKGNDIYRNVLGLRPTDVGHMEENIQITTSEQSNLFLKTLRAYIIYILVTTIVSIIIAYVTINYRRERKLSRGIEKVF